jgi:hypothetical protein
MDDSGNGLGRVRQRLAGVLDVFEDLRRVMADVDKTIILTVETEIREAVAILDEHIQSAVEVERLAIDSERPTSVSDMGIRRLAELLYVEAAGYSADPRMCFERAKAFFKYAETAIED